MRGTPILVGRADSSSSSSSLVCPTNVGTCNVKCSSGEECVLRAQSEHECATYYCAPIANGGHNTPVGSIVGGVVGGIVGLVIIGLLIWWFFIRGKKNIDNDDEIVMSGLETVSNDLDSSYAISNMESQADATGGLSGSFGSMVSSEKRPQNRRLSTYESFTRPVARYARNNKVQNRSINNIQKLQRNQQLQYNQQQIYPHASNRSSVATSISTTNASNMLPIAYIPGVTVRPTVNNTRSIYSYETESVFSDLNTIENASIIGSIRHQQTDTKDSTMTAIKAQPRLVNVGKIEEEEEDEEEEDEDEDDEDDKDDSNSDDEVTKVINSSGSSKLHHITSSNSDATESDSDVDSDIGEIVRATSLRRQHLNLDNNLSQQPEGGSTSNPDTITHSLSQFRPHTDVGNRQSHVSSQGSFLLNVDIDTTSPFDDPNSSRK